MIIAINEIDMLPLIEKLNREYGEVESGFAGVEMMPYFVKAAFMALNEFPTVNKNRDDHTILFEYPSRKAIVYEADNSEVPAIADTVFESLNTEMEDQLSSEQLSDVTFSIANIPNSYQTMVPGGSMWQNLLVSILTLHAIREKPHVINSIKVEVRPVMFITLSYQNQVTPDVAKRFLDFMKSKIESPDEIYTDQALLR